MCQPILLYYYSGGRSIMFELFIVYCIGTLLGIWFGFKAGAISGAKIMLDGLINQAYILHRTDSDGEVVLMKPTLENLQQNQ